MPVIASTAYGRGAAPDVLQQYLMPSPGGMQRASQQRIPCEPHRTLRAADLEREYNETRRAANLALRKDPRPKPADFDVSYDHLSACTSCRNRAGAQRATHASKVLHPGGDWQLLVDDFTVGSWENALRFLNKPSRVQPALRPDPARHDGMFGCPCSVAPAPAPAPSHAPVPVPAPSARTGARRTGAPNMAPRP